jgi:hypothetical protein
MFLWSRARMVRKAESSPPSVSLLSRKCGKFNTIPWAPTACYGEKQTPFPLVRKRIIPNGRPPVTGIALLKCR